MVVKLKDNMVWKYLRILHYYVGFSHNSHFFSFFLFFFFLFCFPFSKFLSFWLWQWYRISWPEGTQDFDSIFLNFQPYKSLVSLFHTPEIFVAFGLFIFYYNIFFKDNYTKNLFIIYFF